MPQKLRTSTNSIYSMASAEKIFNEAASSFKADLSEEDRASLTAETAESLVEFLTNHINNLNTPHRSRLHDAISKISSFARAFGPYFKMVELTMSSNQEISATAWSGVRLVFQVSDSVAAFVSPTSINM